MFWGKIKDAIKLLCDSEGGEVLQLDDCVSTCSTGSMTVFEVLKEKHPSAQPPFWALSFHLTILQRYIQ